MEIFFSSLAVVMVSAITLAMEPCIILTSSDTEALPAHDGLAIMLSNAPICPENIMQLEALLIDKRWSFFSHMVANRGRKNLKSGSFSFFEVAQGPLPDGRESEIFLGHFTALIDNVIVLDQSPDEGKLMIEAIAFDNEKGLYNFYELMGQGNRAQWFYRGDSEDALLDNQYLYRTPPAGEKKFGDSMRCSACHNNGGPIMKELTHPYNDWSTNDRPLILESPLSADVEHRVKHLFDAADFANRVIIAAGKLEKSAAYRRAKNARSWQEKLRPLFCATEINLESSALSIDTDEERFTIPSAFVINPLIVNPTFNFSTQHYRVLIDRFKLVFPETTEKDADHMWLTPVISHVDRRAIWALINDNVITQKEAIDILMIDFENPLFSKKRCELLSCVPNAAPDWLAVFKKNLSQRKDLAEALMLLKYLDEDDSFLLFHEPRLEAYINSIETPATEEILFRRLLEIRQQVFVEDISKNPLGQPMEPGFRVIFPKRLF